MPGCWGPGPPQRCCGCLLPWLRIVGAGRCLRVPLRAPRRLAAEGPGSLGTRVLPANTDLVVPGGPIPNHLESSSLSVSYCIRSLLHLSISATDMAASSLARRSSGLPRPLPSAVSWGRTPVFSVGSSCFGLVGGVGRAPTPPGACASGWVSGSRGLGGVQHAVPVTAFVLSVVGASVVPAAVAWRCVPPRV